MNHLISKYHVAAPRYTSYPTVPYWKTTDFTVKDWEKAVTQSFRESNDKEGISIYIHLPFVKAYVRIVAVIPGSLKIIK